MTALFIIAGLYLTGVALFTLYAAVMSKGWNNDYALGKSIRFGLQWPLLALGFDRRTR